MVDVLSKGENVAHANPAEFGDDVRRKQSQLRQEQNIIRQVEKNHGQLANDTKDKS